MAFTVKDFADLRRLLVEHPEWREELRQLVLSDELLTLPELVRKLAEAQTRTEQRLEELAQAQARTEQRLERLEAAVQELVEAQTRTEQRLKRLEVTVQELAEAQTRTEQTMNLIATRQNQLRGDMLAMSYADRAYAYFGHALRRMRVFMPGTSLDQAVEDRLEELLTPDELNQVFWLDLVARGHLRQAPATADTEVWIAVEVSAVIDRSDVERAEVRAALLRKAGLRAIPVVAGEGITQGATELLRDLPVVMMLDGRSEGWDRALAAYRG